MKRKAIQDVDLESFKSRFADESDRAAAVLGGSLLDARLKDLFRIRLCADQDRLLGRYGPLSTFSSRISLALALRWIDEDTAHDLDVIRDIRNDFAHHLDHELSFSTQSIADRCESLRSAKAHIEGYTEAARANPNFSTKVFESIKQRFSTPRWRYQIAVDSIDQILAAISDPIHVAYTGPSLIAECFDASARVRFKIHATGTVKRAADRNGGEEP
jgi:hypothetical protein